MSDHSTTRRMTKRAAKRIVKSANMPYALKIEAALVLQRLSKKVSGR